MSYFKAPSHGLDPHLFDAEKLKPVVGTAISYELGRELAKHLRLHGSSEWLSVWLAGSGVTYQWDGNTDLDVLFGVDYPRFAAWNPEFDKLPEDEVASYVNSELREDLWPRTANMDLQGKEFEVTYYWNPGIGRDIRAINPYAAYDIKRDRWAVRPPSLPPDPRSLYPQEWHAAAEEDTKRAYAINTAYHQASEDLNGRSAAMARWLYDEIHHGRAAAFAAAGKGYSDFANFRWQSAKEHGLIDMLKGIISHADRADTPANVLLSRAMHQYNNGRNRR